MLNLKFRYATQGGHYNPSLNFLIHHLGFVQSKETRTNLQRMTKIIETLHEVERVEIEKKFEGRRLIDAIFKIYPTKEFISIMIENNKAKKRTSEVIIDGEGNPLIEPMQSDFESSSEYQNAKREYEINKGKHLFGKKKNLFN